KFEAGDRSDMARVRELAELAFVKRDVERQRSLSGRYFELLNGEVNEDVISFAEQFCTSSSMPAFDWFIKYDKEVDAIRHRGHAASEVIEVLLGEIYYKGGYSSYEEVDWKAYKKEVDSKYPAYSKALIALTKAAHYSGGKDPKQFGKYVKRYM